MNKTKSLVLSDDLIKNKIYTIRGIQIMLDKDLAGLYDAKAIRLREQVDVLLGASPRPAGRPSLRRGQGFLCEIF